jgi:Fe-S-cluster containining protein
VGYNENEINFFKLNKWLAYKGKVGRERASFCNEYIRNKNLVFETITARQQEAAQTNGETVSCRPGCVYCCYHYVTATLDEIEAIVYYLYRNENALNGFLAAYRSWKTKIETNKTLLRDISKAYNDHLHDRDSAEKQELFQTLANQYNTLDIPCPFLSENRCLIYPVRPWVCAGYFAVTPNDWCRPDSPHKARTLSISNFKDMRKIVHYRNSRGLWMNMPKAVFAVLQGGIYTLAKIPGMETLERETLDDPEVKELLARLR